MRKPRIFLLFLLMMSPMFLSLLTICPITANAATIVNYWDKYTVFTSQFQQNVTNLPAGVRIEYTPPVLEKFDIVDAQLLNSSSTENYYVFRSLITMNWDVQFFTDDTAQEVFPNRYKMGYYRNWLTLRTCATETDATFGNWISDESYAVGITDYNLGAMASTGCAQYMNFDLTMNDPTPEQITFENGIVMFPRAFTATLTESVVVSSRGGDIISGDTHYKEDISVKLDATSFIREDILNTGDTTAQNLLINQIAADNIGVSGGPVLNDTAAYQTGERDISEGRLVNDNQLWVNLKPTIIRNYQQIQVKFGFIDMDTVDNWASPPRILEHKPLENQTYTRTLGATVTNKFVRATIRSSFILVSIASLDPRQTSEPISLSDPNVVIDDTYWDNIISGSTGVTVPITEDGIDVDLNPFDDFWADIENLFAKYGPWILFGGAAIIGLIVVFWIWSKIRMAQTLVGR